MSWPARCSCPPSVGACRDNGRVSGRLLVAAAAIVEAGRLLVVSKHAAPDVFYLPGGKPEPGEDNAAAVRREIAEELAVTPTSLEPFTVVDEMAALEAVPMRMTVFLAELDRPPCAAAEIARLAWTTGSDRLTPSLAPAVARHVVPRLVEDGLLPSSSRWTAATGPLGERERRDLRPPSSTA
jgi:8-oxo-dGTP diphosphatase